MKRANAGRAQLIKIPLQSIGAKKERPHLYIYFVNLHSPIIKTGRKYHIY